MNCNCMDHFALDSLPDYIPLRQGSKINCLYSLLSPREARCPKPELTDLGDGMVKIEEGETAVYIENYPELTAHSKGGYRLNTFKLLDFLIWQLGRTNRPPGSGGKCLTPICTQLTLPLEQYIRCCGYEAAITDSKRKDSQKELRKDLRLLCATQIGWDTGDKVPILDIGCVQNGQIVAAFSDRMAYYLLHQCLSMWYPLKLLHLNGRSLMSYSLGRSMALHSSITSNQLRGTDGVLSVRSLLKCCRSLPAPEVVRAWSGSCRHAIVLPFTEALDRLLDMEIIEWNYRGDEEFPENYADFLREYVEYTMLKMPEGLQKLDHKKKG